MEQTLIVTDVNAEDVDKLWEMVKGNLEHALEYSRGEYTIEDIYWLLLSGDMRLWIAYDAAGKLQTSAVCEMRSYPQKVICYIVLSGGGSFANWKYAVDMIEDWAIENGADAVCAYTRPAIAKGLREHGYASAYTVIHKDLKERRLH